MRTWNMVNERKSLLEYWQIMGVRSDDEQVIYLNFPHSVSSKEAREKLDTFLREDCACVSRDNRKIVCLFHTKMLKEMETV